ncbi:MAG: carbon-nitrogen hydrolase family protein [Polyangiaceae bacterium]|nr:carbon-nitrogen hydrolase family protein [Polyangiaceae bacterium]
MRTSPTWAAVQMSSQGDLEANLEAVVASVHRSADRGAGVVLLPENFAFMGDEAAKREIAEALDGDGPIVRALRGAAAARRITVIGGGLPERSADPDRPYNTCAVFGPDGLLARYRKIHLFDVDLPDGTTYRESASTTAGSTPVTMSIDATGVGLSICYDLRFPELYRALSLAGVEVIVVPAAFTLQTGKDHWLTLLRARAIESQSYVVAAAQWGKHPRGRLTFGKTCIIDPWGDVVAQASEGEGVIVSTLDLGYLQRVRRTLPALTHRRL